MIKSSSSEASNRIAKRGINLKASSVSWLYLGDHLYSWIPLFFCWPLRAAQCWMCSFLTISIAFEFSESEAKLLLSLQMTLPLVTFYPMQTSNGHVLPWHHPTNMQNTYRPIKGWVKMTHMLDLRSHGPHHFCFTGISWPIFQVSFGVGIWISHPHSV